MDKAGKQRRWVVTNHYDKPHTIELHVSGPTADKAILAANEFVANTPAKSYLHHAIKIGYRTKQEVTEVTRFRDCDGAPITGIPDTGDIDNRRLPAVVYACDDVDHEEGLSAEELAYIPANNYFDDPAPEWLCVDCYYNIYSGPGVKKWSKFETLAAYMKRMNLGFEDPRAL